MPPAENAGPDWGMRAQVLDSFKVGRENAVPCLARYAAEIATIMKYYGAVPAAELHKLGNCVSRAREVNGFCQV